MSRRSPDDAEKAVYAYFAVYRECIQQLSGDFDGPTEPNKAKRGYELAVHPKAIRGSLQRASSPIERALLYDRTEEDQLSAFCDKLTRALRKLPKYQRELIRGRFLVPLPQHLPTDREVWESLCRAGWRVNEEYFREQKQESIEFLVTALGIDKLLAKHRPRRMHPDGNRE